MPSETWADATLHGVCEDGGVIQTGPFGSQLHASDYVHEGVPVIMPVNIGDGRVVEQGIARVPEQDAARLSRHRLNVGDIVYSRRGDVTRRALIGPSEAGWLCGTGCLLVRPGRGVIPEWLSYWLATPWTHTWLHGHAVGATMPNLNTAILSAVPVTLPPIDEQRRIAGVLGAFDDLIDTNHDLVARMEALLASVFEEEGFDSNSGDGLLGDVISVNPFYRKPTGVAPYVDMAALPTQGARISIVGNRKAAGGARFTVGDTLLARITPCLENGKTAFVDVLEIDEVGVGSTEFIVLRDKTRESQHWPYFLARSERFRSYAIRHMTGTSGRQRCPADAVARYPLAAPERENLRRFEALADPLFAAMRQLDAESEELAHTRDELLPLLMSGRITVDEAWEAIP